MLFNSSFLWIKAAFPYPGAGCTVDAYVCQKNGEKTETQWINLDGTQTQLQIDSSAPYLTNNQSHMITSICKKVLRLPPQDNGLFIRKPMGGLIRRDTSVIGNFTSAQGAKFKHSQHQHPHIHQHLQKVIMSDNRDFRPFYDPGTLGIGDHVHYILVPDQKTALWFIALVNSRLSRFFQWVFCEGYNGQAGKHGGEPWNSALPLSIDRKSTRLNSSHMSESRMPSSA